MNKPIQVLHVMIGDGNYNGIAGFLLNYYSHIDHDMVHFDFLYARQNSMCTIENSSVLKESSIFTLSALKENNNGIFGLIKLINKLSEHFNNHSYDIIHVNTQVLFFNICVSLALRGRAILVLHSHNADKQDLKGQGGIKQYLKRLLSPIGRYYINKKADACFACSKAAGIALFGEAGVRSSKFKIIKNAIEIEKYSFNREVRESLRSKYGVSDKVIYGFVGRLSAPKNLIFLISVFYELHKINNASIMWIVGDGELRDEVSNEIKRLELNDDVRIWGLRNDVAYIMQAFDAFLFPSICEGFGLSVIEAQAAGLPVFASDSIPEETRITPLSHSISLNLSEKNWADIITREMNRFTNREKMDHYIRNAGFDIEEEAKKLASIYEGFI